MTKYPVTKVETLTTPVGKTVRVAWANGSPWFLGRDLLLCYDSIGSPTKIDAAVRHVEKVNKRMIKRMIPEGQKKSEFFFDPDAAKFLSVDREEHADMRNWIDEMSGWKKFFEGNAKSVDKHEESCMTGDISVVTDDDVNQVFFHEEFGQVRTIEHNQDTWFVAVDVCNALGYSNSRQAIQAHVDNEDKGVTKCDTLGGKQNVVIINESGLYALILGSTLESAKRFKRWVTGEVLPAIRKTGGYFLGEKNMTEEDLLASALVVAQRKIKEKTAQLQKVEKEKEALIEANAELDTANKALYADNSSWPDRTIITTLVPAIATRRCMTINNVYAELYREAKKKYHFDLYARRNNYTGNEPKPIIAFASEEELHKLTIMVATVGYRCKLDLHKLLNPVNAQYAMNIAETDQ